MKGREKKTYTCFWNWSKFSVTKPCFILGLVILSYCLGPLNVQTVVNQEKPARGEFRAAGMRFFFFLSRHLEHHCCSLLIVQTSCLKPWLLEKPAAAGNIAAVSVNFSPGLIDVRLSKGVCSMCELCQRSSLLKSR